MPHKSQAAQEYLSHLNGGGSRYAQFRTKRRRMKNQIPQSTSKSQDNHDSGFKAKVALAAISSKKMIVELSSEFSVHQTLIHKWGEQLKESAPGIFSGEIKKER